jgi:predicted SprT family Zn-dependent metalloprotease
MFDIFCPAENARVLLFAHNIEKIQNKIEGIEVHYHCHCGQRGVLHTGRRHTSIRQAKSEAMRS